MVQPELDFEEQKLPRASRVTDSVDCKHVLACVNLLQDSRIAENLGSYLSACN